MRYHWGLGIGHIYSHGHTQISHATRSPAATRTSGTEPDNQPVSEEIPDQQPQDDSSESDIEKPELSFRNGEDDLGEADEVDSESGDDLELLDMVVMYGEGVMHGSYDD